MIRSVLLLERDDACAEALEQALESRGWRVIRARDVGTGLLAVQSAQPSVALLAIDHPEGEGTKLLRALRSLDGMKDFPVVLLDGAAASHAQNKRTSTLRDEETVLVRPVDEDALSEQLQWTVAFAATAALKPADADPAMAKVERAAEEAARAALDEAVEKEERLYRWTREREAEREARRVPEQVPDPPPRHGEARTERVVAATPEVAIELLTRALSHAGEVRLEMRIEGSPLPLAGADARFVAALLDGETLAGAAAAAALSTDRARAIVLYGLLTGTLRPKRAPAPEVAAGLEHWIEAHLGADYFAILGASRDAGTQAIEAAHAERCRTLDLPLDSGDPRVSALAEQARRMLDEARAVLCRPELRAAYRRHLG